MEDVSIQKKNPGLHCISLLLQSLPVMYAVLAYHKLDEEIRLESV